MAASIFGLITFIIGGFFGFAVYHYFFRLSNQERKLLDELNHAKSEFKQYHDQVADNLTQSATLIDQLQENSRKLHEHILNASVALNRSHKQSLLQPVLHADPIHHDDHEDEQVTEFHPTHVPSKSRMTPPKDYV